MRPRRGALHGLAKASHGELAERRGESVGEIGAGRCRLGAKEIGDHPLYLRLLGSPVPRDRLLDRRGRVLDHLDAGRRQGREQHPPRVRKLERRPRGGAVERGLHGGDVRLQPFQQPLEALSEQVEAAWQRLLRREPDLSAIDQDRPVDVSGEEPPPRAVRAGIDPQDAASDERQETSASRAASSKVRLA